MADRATKVAEIQTVMRRTDGKMLLPWQARACRKMVRVLKAGQVGQAFVIAKEVNASLEAEHVNG